MSGGIGIEIPRVRVEPGENGKDEVPYDESKTTEIYTHVSRKNLEQITSPLDTLNLYEGGEK